MESIKDTGDARYNKLLKIAGLGLVGAIALAGCGSNGNNQTTNNPAEATNSQPNNEQGVTNNEVSVGEFDDKYLNADVEPKYDAKELIEQINFFEDNGYPMNNSDVYIKALQLADQGKPEQAAKVLEENGIGQGDIAVNSVASEEVCKKSDYRNKLYGSDTPCYYHIASSLRAAGVPQYLQIWGDKSLQPTGDYSFTLEYTTSSYPIQSAVERLYEGNEEAVKQSVEYENSKIAETDSSDPLAEDKVESKKLRISGIEKIPEVVEYYNNK